MHLVSVRQDYEMSQRIASVAGVKHASPQIIMLRDGNVVADTSHEGITADNLADMLQSASDLAR